ncbi:MAG: uridine phosphorylase [Patiriisocius sp.]|jgi:uridine phosphorylase
MQASNYNRIGELAKSELILNKDGSAYHISLRDEHVKENVIVVGDMGRVERVSKHFDTVTDTIHNREFFTKIGVYKGKEITVMSTGIGTDNIDIAVHELDVAVNIDPIKREFREKKRSLNIIRIGTSGALQEDIEVDSFVAGKYGLGFDGLLNFYDVKYDKEEISLRDAFIYHSAYPERLTKPYIVESNQDLRLKIAYGMTMGITATASGFYGPQGRILRLPLKYEELNSAYTSFEWKGERITNFEMETSALYGLSSLLGHNAVTVCAIIANRLRGEFSADYKKTVDGLIETVLDRL